MKYEIKLNMGFDKVYSYIKNNFKNISESVTIENESKIERNNLKISFLTYERYSYFGGNRVSLTVLVVGDEFRTDIHMVTSGGSRAVFFKINTVGEERFLNLAIKCLNELDGRS